MASASGEMKQSHGSNEISSMPSLIGKAVLEQCCHGNVHLHQNGYRHSKDDGTHGFDDVSDGHGSSFTIESCDCYGRFSNNVNGVFDAHSNSLNGASDGLGGSSSGVLDGHGSFLNTDSFGDVCNGHNTFSNADSLSDGHGSSSNTNSFDGVPNVHGKSSYTDCVGGVSDGHGRSSNTDSVDGISEGHGRSSNTNSFDGVSSEDKKGCHGTYQNGHDVAEAATSRHAKRLFCERCRKVQKLCICKRFKGVVQNSIKITILQNPEEKHHAVGSARVALLGLQNVALVNVPEVYSKESFRIRPKVPGSKRSLAGRGGKKLILKGGNTGTVSCRTSTSDVEVLQLYNLLAEIFKDDSNHIFNLERMRSFMHPSDSSGMADGALPLEKPHSFTHLNSDNGKVNGCMHTFRPPQEAINIANWSMHSAIHPEESGIVDGFVSVSDELEILIPRGVALLYPSEKAVELSEPFFSMARHDEKEANLESHPCHLIVLDGTWSKARRIYFENPWLQSIPHYKLSLSSPSLYEGVRKQPKPGCLSTLESIVYALKVLEPETKGIDGLLEVFDSMIEDQRRCKQMKSCVSEPSVE